MSTRFSGYFQSGLVWTSSSQTRCVASCGSGTYCIGHSYFCGEGLGSTEPAAWYKAIVQSEIVPLLREYWADDLDKARLWEKRLLGP